MTEISRHRTFGAQAGWLARAVALTPVALAAVLTVSSVSAQDRSGWDQGDPPARQAQPARPRRDDAYRPQDDYTAPSGGFGRQAGPDGRPWDGQQQPSYGQPYGGQQSYGQPYGGQGGYDQGGQPYGGVPGQNYDPRYAAPAPQQAPYGGGRGNDAYRPPGQYGGQYGGGPGYQGDKGGYGQPYSPPPENGAPVYSEPGYGQGQQYGNQGWDERRGGSTYSQNEVVDAGHRFFGSVSQGLARAVENLFKSQGRPNGYILGEDAGGAFVAGLRYGEGTLFTKDVGSHRVFWQGPSLGYDFGGEGSKTMVLVYRLRDPSDIYNRFGGVQGSAYLIGGVSVQLQTYEHVTLAVIRSGVGLRLGANVGYLKYTRTPTWNPF